MKSSPPREPRLPQLRTVQQLLASPPPSRPLINLQAKQSPKARNIDLVRLLMDEPTRTLNPKPSGLSGAEEQGAQTKKNSPL